MLCIFGVHGSRAFGAAPPNDDFANRITLSGVSASATINNLEQAVTEGGEPLTNSSYPYSVWYEWTAPDDGIVRIDATNSQYPHAIDVFFGSTLGSLNAVAADTGSTSAFAFQEIPVTQGSVLVFRYRGGNTYPYTSPGENGYLYVNLRTNTSYNGIALARPSTINNDLFANRIAITGSITAIGYQKFATREGGEPTSTGDYTTWWEWTAPSAGTVNFQSLVVTRFGLDGSDRDTISVWSGTQLASLTLIGSRTPTGTTPISTTVSAGQKIQIAMANTTYPGPNASVLSVSFTGAPVPAQMLTPPSGSTFASSSATFTWDSGTGVTGYALWIGSTPGGTDIYMGNEGTSLSKLVTGLPGDGRNLYVRLYSLIGGSYQSTDYTYHAYTAPAPVKAAMVSPVNGSSLPGTSATFTWDSGSGVTGYALWIGSTAGGSDIYSGNEGTNLFKTVTTLPNDGRTLYVTLYSLINGSYQSNAYTYTAWRAPQAQKAWLTSPANGSTLPTTSLPLVWNLGSGVTSCYLFVGTTSGGYDLYAGDQGTATSRTLTVPAGGGRVYVTLWSLINGAYKGNSYYFVTTPAVRAALSVPSNGSTLTGNQLNLSWTQGTGVSQYYVYVGTTYGGYDIAAVNAGTATSRTITVPQTGAPVYVTIWSLINGGFQGNNYWFTTALPVSGNRPALITSPANAGTLGSATMNLAWDTGSGVMSYALWVGSTPGGYDLYSGLEGTSRTKQVVVPADGRRIYVTLHSLIGGDYQSASYWFTAATLPDGGAAQITSPTPGSTLGGASLALSWSPVAGASQYYLFVGKSPGASDLYAANEGTGTSRTVTVPTDGRPVYTTLYSLINGVWKPSSAWFATANTFGGNKPALITSHANGSTLGGAANTFSWAGGSGVAAYALWIGSNPGGYDLWSSADGLNTSRAVNLPTDGRKLYVTLYSSIGGAWQGASYIYTAATQAAAKAALTSPANGTTFSSTSQTFTWSSATGAAAYALWIGRTPGGYDVYAGAEGANVSRTVTTLPNDGSPLYMTLYSLIGGVWQSNEYIFTAWLQP